MVIYQRTIKMKRRIMLPEFYAAHTHYEIEYHGLLLSRVPDCIGFTAVPLFILNHLPIWNL